MGAMTLYSPGGSPGITRDRTSEREGDVKTEAETELIWLCGKEYQGSLWKLAEAWNRFSLGASRKLLLSSSLDSCPTRFIPDF